MDFGYKNTRPQMEEDFIERITEDGPFRMMEDSHLRITEESKINILFGDRLAIDVLKEALKEFPILNTDLELIA